MDLGRGVDPHIPYDLRALGGVACQKLRVQGAILGEVQVIGVQSRSGRGEEGRGKEPGDEGRF